MIRLFVWFFCFWVVGFWCLNNSVAAAKARRDDVVQWNMAYYHLVGLFSVFVIVLML